MKNKQIDLNAIGFWFNSELPNWPDPKLLINYKWDQKLKAEIVNYLRSGYKIGAYLGYSWCRINGSQYDMDEKLGCCEFSDGWFLWPEGLTYYLENFDIELPPFFVEKLIENNFKKNEENLKVLSKKIEFSFDPLEQDSSNYLVYYDKWLNWWKDWKKQYDGAPRKAGNI